MLLVLKHESGIEEQAKRYPPCWEKHVSVLFTYMSVSQGGGMRVMGYM